MAEAIAPPQPTLLDNIGDFFRSMRTGGISLADNAPAGAIAPSAAPVAAVAPVAVAAPVTTSKIASSYVLPATAKDQEIANVANVDGSSKSYLQAAAQADTPDSRKALMLRANNAAAGETKYADTLGKVDAKGGINSQDGRLEYQKLWRNRDNSPEYMNAFIQYLMGNTKAAKRYLSGGQVVNKVQINTTNGHAIQYAVDENGEYHGAYDLDAKKQLTQDEFEPQVSTFGVLDQSIPFNQRKDNIKDWTAKFNNEAEKANSIGAAAEPLYRGYQAWDNALKDLNDISPSLASELSRYGTQVIGTTAAQSQAATAFSQKAQSAGLKKGDTVSASLAAGFEGAIPKLAGAKFNGNGEFTSTDGTTFNIDNLSQGTSNANRSAEMDKRFTASAQDLIKDAKIKALMEQDPTGVAAKKFTAALDLAKSIALQEEKVGSHAFNVPTVGFGVTDEFNRGRIQAQQGMLNQKTNAAYAQYVNKMTQQFGPGDAPRPGNLLKGFMVSDEYKAIVAEFKDSANKLLKEPSKYALTPAGVGLGGETSVAPAIPNAVPNSALATQYGYDANTAMPTIEVPSAKAAVPPPAATANDDAAKRAAAIKAAREAAKK